MENKPSLLLVCLGYGVIIALAMIVLHLILFLLNLDQVKGLGLLEYVILIGGVWLAQFNFRAKYTDGFIEYGKAFSVGMVTSLWLSVIMGVFMFIFFKYIDPGAVEEIMLQQEQAMMDRGMTDLEIEQGIAIASMFKSPAWLGVTWFLGDILTGIIFSLVIAIFVKKENTGMNQPGLNQ